jgi:integrase
VQILEHWFRHTRDEHGAKEDDALYFVPNLPEFKLDSLHRAMADTAHRMGLHSDASAPTSHSLRYGGATMMAAAGFPQYLIAQYGGWSEKSSSLKIYTKASAAMIQEVSRHMTEMSKLNVSKMFLIDANIRHQRSGTHITTDAGEA